MEQHLNSNLSSREVVHHIDGNPRNNKIENLELMDFKIHSTKHGFARAHDDWEGICNYCGKKVIKKWKNRPNLKKYKHTFCNRTCMGEFWSENGIGGKRKRKMYYGVCSCCGKKVIKRWSARPELKGYKHTFCDRTCMCNFNLHDKRKLDK